MNTADFVTYDQALALKKLGFREEVNHYYYKDKENIIFEENLYDYMYEKPAYNDFNDSNFIYIDCSAPTLAEVRNWLEKKHGLIICPCPEAKFEIDINNRKNNKYRYIGWIYNILIIYPNNEITNGPNANKDILYTSSEEALSAGISECIDYLNKKLS